MVKKSLKELPVPDIKKQKITIAHKREDKKDTKRKVSHLDEMLDKSFIKDYFEQKKD